MRIDMEEEAMETVKEEEEVVLLDVAMAEKATK